MTDEPLTCGKVAALIQDEWAANQEYRKLKFDSLSDDEFRHYVFLKGIYAKKCITGDTIDDIDQRPPDTVIHLSADDKIVPKLTRID